MFLNVFERFRAFSSVFERFRMFSSVLGHSTRGTKYLERRLAKRVKALIQKPLMHWGSSSKLTLEQMFNRLTARLIIKVTEMAYSIQDFCENPRFSRKSEIIEKIRDFRKNPRFSWKS